MVPAMEPADIEAARAAVIARHGPWSNNNIHLGGGVYTIGAGRQGTAEQNVQRIVQLVADNVATPMQELRVLDLGAYEGSFSVELALRGAEVVAIEARDAHVAKMELAKQALGLERLEIRHGDIRDLGSLSGEFDVVLCLGVLYHLPAADVFGFVEGLGQRCRSLAIVETQVSLRKTQRVEHGGAEYWGRPYAENQSDPGASSGNDESFWLTKPSLLRLLVSAGFSSVSEALCPRVPASAAFEDHVTLLARPGRRVELLSLPESQALRERGWKVPEDQPKVAHPAQGGKYVVRERIARLRGGGLPAVFRKEDE
jgi:protein-L-isoaspartate O-methyltransferase